MLGREYCSTQLHLVKVIGLIFWSCILVMYCILKFLVVRT